MTQSSQTVSQSHASNTASSVSARFLAAVHGAKNGVNTDGFADVLDQAVSSSINQARANADDTAARQTDLSSNEPDEAAPDLRAKADTKTIDNVGGKNTAPKDQGKDVADDAPVERKADVKKVVQPHAAKSTSKTEKTTTSETEDTTQNPVAVATQTSQTQANGAVDASSEKTAQITSNTVETAPKVVDTEEHLEKAASQAVEAVHTASTENQGVPSTKVKTTEATGDTQTTSDDDMAADAASVLLSQMIAMKQAQQNRDAMKEAADKEVDASASTDSLDAGKKDQSGVISFADFAQTRQEALQKSAESGSGSLQTKTADAQTVATAQPEASTRTVTDKTDSRAAFSAQDVARTLTPVQTTPTANAAAAAQAAAGANVIQAAPVATLASATQSAGASINSLSGVASGAGMVGGSSNTAMGNLVALKDEAAPGTNQTSVIEQVKVQLQKMAKTGKDQMTISLTPDEMGKIEIKLKFGDDKSVQGTVIADNKATLDALQKDQAGLQQALKDAGLQADSNSLQFSLRSDGGSFGQSAYGQSSGQSGGQSKSWRLGVVASESEAEGETQNTYSVSPGRVNLRV